MQLSELSEAVMAVLPAEESQLVLLCREGRAEAFGPLVRRYQNAAYAIAWSYVRNRQDAQDLVQEAFITAYCKLGQLHQPAKFGSWLYSIVATRCKEWLRQRKRTSDSLYSLEIADQELAQTAQAEQTSRTLKEELWDSVDRLPEQFRTVVLLHYLSGMSYAEISAFLELPVSTIVGRLQQSRLRLREALLPDELEALEMSKVDVSDQVQETVYQIVVEPVALRLPLQEMRRLVLYCGLDVEVEVRQAEGNEVILEGTKAAIGASPEAARTSVEGIEILYDQVNNFVETGPHAGEEFTGTDNQEGRPVAGTAPTADVWSQYRQNTGWRVDSGADTIALYPFMKEVLEVLPAQLYPDLQQVTRISVIRKVAEDIVLPRTAYTPEIQKVFNPNNTSSERLHGPVGYLHLTLSIPPGSTLTLIGGKKVRVHDLRASINLIESEADELVHLEGKVRLLNTNFKTASDLKGSFYQRFHSYSGTSWAGYQASRSEAWSSKIEKVQGEVEINVGKVELEAAHLAGKVTIRNRHGNTRLYQGQLRQEDRIHLESCSGEIRLFLQEDLIPQISLMATTLCGSVRYDSLRDLDDFKQGNTLQLIAFGVPSRLSWEALRDANFHLKTESGDITIQKMK